MKRFFVFMLIILGIKIIYPKKIGFTQAKEWIEGSKIYKAHSDIGGKKTLDPSDRARDYLNSLEKGSIKGRVSETKNKVINALKKDLKDLETKKEKGEDVSMIEEKIRKRIDYLEPKSALEYVEIGASKFPALLKTKKASAVGGTGVVGLGGLGTAGVGLAGLGTAGAAALEAGDVTEFTSWDESLLGKDEEKKEKPLEVSGEIFKEPEIAKPEATKSETISEEPKKEKIVDQEKVVAEKITTPKDLLKLSEDQELSIQDANDLLNLVAAYVRQNILPKANKLILESEEPIKIIDLHGDEISFNGKNFIKPYQEKIQEAEKAYQEAEKYSKELYDKKSSDEFVEAEEFELAVEKTQKAKEEIDLAKSEMEKTLKSRSVFIPVDGQNTVYGFVQQSVNLIKQ
ncbi:MAG: hypothetical protein ABIA74_01980, partial [bacterium]